MKRSKQVPITSESIKNTRESLGETQVQFAASIGVDQGTLSRWEAGQLPKNGITRSFISRALDDIWRVIPVRQ